MSKMLQEFVLGFVKVKFVLPVILKSKTFYYVQNAAGICSGFCKSEICINIKI
jgi:hypothetical protein